MQPRTIGLDPAEPVFQVHGVDAAGDVVPERRLRRGQMITLFAGLAPRSVGMEACATAHFWARAGGLGQPEAGRGARDKAHSRP